jgi:hypothetical protein
MEIPTTPSLANSSLFTTVCGQQTLNLTAALAPLPACPVANASALVYKFYKDNALTNEITNPTTFNPTANEQTVFVVLANNVTDPTILSQSTQNWPLKLTRNNLITPGAITSDAKVPNFSKYYICSNSQAFEIINEIPAQAISVANLSYEWEVGASTAGPFAPAAGVKTNLNYLPSVLTTANETISHYFFRRKAIATYNGLTCEAATATFEVIVDPCAPIADNNVIENILNPKGTNNLNVPSTLFSSEVKSPARTLATLKITAFPNNCTSLTINSNTVNSSTKNSKSAATSVYCNTPAAPGCVGSAFPVNGVTIPTNAAGNPINTTILVDPITDGSFQVDVPYLAIDNLGFSGRPANASMVLIANGPLPISLLNFDVTNKEGNLKLNWKTSNETNFSHFEIDGAKNNFSFTKLATLNQNESHNYEHVIQNAENGNWYFKLKMVDLDGKFTYSKTISIVKEGDFNNEVVVKGNPTQKYIKTDLKLNPGTYNIELFDQTGCKKVSNSITINNPELNYQINQTPLNSGFYILRISNIAKNTSISSKIIVE